MHLYKRVPGDRGIVYRKHQPDERHDSCSVTSIESYALIIAPNDQPLASNRLTNIGDMVFGGCTSSDQA